MDQAAFDDYKENRYKKQMEYYSKVSATNQKCYKNYQWVLIIFSALTPVLAALSTLPWFKEINKDVDSVIKVVLVIISSVVAILTTGLKTFQYQELWITYRSTYEQLKPEIYYYELNVPPYVATGIDKEALFVARVESILNKEHIQWPPAKEVNKSDGARR
jgi:hypothetical protein